MTNITCVVIPDDTQDAIYEVRIDPTNRDQITDMVGGGFYRLEMKNSAVCFINEQCDTPAKPAERLCLNTRATALLNHVKTGYPDIDAEFIHVVGPLLIAGPEDTNGKLTSIPPVLHSLLFDHESYKIEYQEVGDAVNWRSSLKVYTDPFGAAIDAMQIITGIDVVAVRIAPA